MQVEYLAPFSSRLLVLIAASMDENAAIVDGTGRAMAIYSKYLHRLRERNKQQESWKGLRGILETSSKSKGLAVAQCVFATPSARGAN